MAEEPITGAFGVTLGEAVVMATVSFDYDGKKHELEVPESFFNLPFEQQQATIDSMMRGQKEEGYFRHRFIPKSPIDAFDTYYVHVTPVKGLIFRIGAWREGGSCKSQFLAFKQALSKKYGSGKEASYGPVLKRIWTQGSRSIELGCTSKPRFDLSYTDHFIEASRIDELEPDTSNL